MTTDKKPTRQQLRLTGLCRMPGNRDTELEILEQDRYQESMVFRNGNKQTHVQKTNSQRTTDKCDYKYTVECNALCSILGCEEELNNSVRWETHEGNNRKNNRKERSNINTKM